VEQPFEFQIGDDCLDDERADIRLLAEIVAADVEFFSRAEHTGRPTLRPPRGSGVSPRVKFSSGTASSAQASSSHSGGQPIAAGAPDFLLIILEGLGQIEMDDAADVRLVDAHAEGDGRER